jgi:energy-coupling factor transporter ATP-binding protein EcfA2
VLEYHRVTYTYPDGDRPALRAVDLQVQQGDLLAIVGRSGSGKSSLLWAANGLIPYFYGGRFAGEVVVCGKSTRQTAPHALAAHVGTVFQEPARRFVSRSVLDEIAFGLEIAGVDPEAMRHQVEAVVERMGLGPLIGRPLDQMSGGEQQRVALAAALARRPEILLLDEPTSQLDRQGATGLFAWLEERRSETGAVTLVVEHRLEELSAVATRAAYLDPTGGLAAFGPTAEVWPTMPYAPPMALALRAFGIDSDAPDGQARLRQVLERLAGQVLAKNGHEPGPVVLSGRGICANYDGASALEDVDIDLSEGSVTAILGENGSGKTTLLRSLMGLMPLSRGEVRVRGVRIDKSPVSERAGSIGYVPQWPSALLFADSVRDELAFTLAQIDANETDSGWANRLLARLDLTDVADRYPRDLSAGQRQRAALAAVLVARPRVILLDEPTLGMDPVAKGELVQLLRSLAAEGAAVAVATHDVEFAARVADRVAILVSGHLRANGPTDATLYRSPDHRTVLQKLTGAVWPATLEEAEAISDKLHKSTPQR